MKKIFTLLMLCSFAICAEPVDINKADAETISKNLTGIGPKKAEAIVQYRQEHGAFKTAKELENVNGIGEKTVLANEKDIVVSVEEAQPAAKAKAEKNDKSSPTKKNP